MGHPRPDPARIPHRSSPASPVRYQLLGPLRAWLGDTEVDLGPGKQRAVLAVLLLHPNRPVSTAQIVDAVWQDDPPVNGANVVQKYIAGLRRALEPERALLARTDAGYLLRVPPASTDTETFHAEARAGRAALAAGNPAEATAHLQAALARWHAEPLAGLTGPLFDSARDRLGESRAEACETWAAAELALGHHGRLIADLRRLIDEYPLREELRAQLILALYRAGRQAEALAAYRDTRQLLADEYGVDPGHRLQDLHRRILQSDPTLADAEPPAAVTSSPTISIAGTSDAPAPPPLVDPSPAMSPPAALSPAALAPLSPHAPPPASADGAFAPPPIPSPSIAGHVVEPAYPAGAAPANHPAEPTDTPLAWTPPADWLESPPTYYMQRRHRWALGFVAAGLIPFLTFGLATWAVFLFFAARWSSRLMGVLSVLYLGLFALFFGIAATSDPDKFHPIDILAFGSWLTVWLGGTGHAMVVAATRRVRPTPPSPAMAPDRQAERRTRRAQARELAAARPDIAWDLRIGRPDLPRPLDDGGLVDVNGAPERVLSQLPGISPETAWRIVSDRDARGPFATVGDLAERNLVPRPLLSVLGDVLIAIPPVPPQPPSPSQPPSQSPWQSPSPLPSQPPSPEDGRWRSAPP